MLMNWIDWSIVLIISYLFLLSLKRGFIKEALSLINWFSAFFITKHFHLAFAMYLSFIQDIMLRNGVAIFFLLLASLLVGKVVNNSLYYFIERKGLAVIDRLLATVFGVIKGVLIVCLCLFLVDLLTSFSNTNAWNSSIFIPHFSMIIKWFFTSFA